MFTCSKVINAFKRQNSWADTFRKTLSLIFPKLSSQNTRGFDHATIISPTFHGVRKERLTQWTPICDPETAEKSRGTSRKIGWGCAARFLKTLRYFRPKSVIFTTLFQTWSPGARCVTGARETHTVVGVNIKREMVLSPNDEEVANSSKKKTNSRLECTNYTLFQTKMVEIDTLFQTKTVEKPYPLAPHIPI